MSGKPKRAKRDPRMVLPKQVQAQVKAALASLRTPENTKMAA